MGVYIHIFWTFFIAIYLETAIAVALFEATVFGLLQ